MTASMTADNIVGLVIGAALFAFLIVALILPERF